MIERSLQKRIFLTVILGISLIFFSFGVTAYYITKKTIENSLTNNLALCRTIRDQVDYFLSENINRLYDISLSGSINLDDRNFIPEKEALKRAYHYSIFKEGIFIADKKGTLLLNFPERPSELFLNILSIEPVSKAIELARPVISNIYTIEPSMKKIIFVLVPLRDSNGNLIGIAGGEIDPTSPFFSSILRLEGPGDERHIEIIDSNGVVIASSKRARILSTSDHNSFIKKSITEKREAITTCHECHSEKISSNSLITLVPSRIAPWAVVLREKEETVFSTVKELKETFLTLAILFTGLTLIITIGVSRSIVNPIQNLIKITEKIADGDLSHTIPVYGDDEIGSLSRSFEKMRKRLLEYTENIKKYNLELEKLVMERTLKVRESKQRIQNLLKKIITSQEEERKRISRELHDETLQDLSAILMRIDMCKLYPQNITQEKIEEVRNITLKAIDGIFNIIQNMRPSILDDLGLESAIRWLLGTHLKEKGIEYYLNIDEAIKDMRFSPEIEITIFRIVQEAITNIARHSNAKNAFINMQLTDKNLLIEIEDDGDGFDIYSIFNEISSTDRTGRGLGLLGMKERASLIGGKLKICSSRDAGTRIIISIPAEIIRREDDKSIDS
ncbi:MAG: HAMP domain-containing protein [Thermodesulfovibrionales bacterium]|nr:HAMP domain-containing protein [Thermodesulfovibrionales bacterium]